MFIIAQLKMNVLSEIYLAFKCLKNIIVTEIFQNAKMGKFLKICSLDFSEMFFDDRHSMEVKRIAFIFFGGNFYYAQRTRFWMFLVHRDGNYAGLKLCFLPK